MTIEEAKKELERFVKIKTTLRPAFLDVILNALETKTPELDEEGSARGRLIRETDVVPLEDYKSRFMDAPTVEPKHGHWIINNNRHTCSCSNCKNIELVDWAIDQANYCPNCGAYMRGEEDDK